MKFFPYENFLIITPLNPGEIEVCLRRLIQKPDRSAERKKSAAFQPYFSGYFENGTFELKEIITYRGSILPVINGAIAPHLNGSRVSIKIKLDILLFVMWCLVFCSSGLLALTFICLDFITKSFEGFTFIPLGVCIYIYALVIISFNVESRNAKTRLLHLLQGEIQNPDFK